MAEFKVLRSFGGNVRGKTVELTKKEAEPLLAGSRPYVAEVPAKDPKK